MRVDYLAVCRADCELEKLLFAALRAGYVYISGDVEPNDDELRRQILFPYAKPCAANDTEGMEKCWLRAFSIEPEVDEDNEERFLTDFHASLGGEGEGLLHLVKLYDSHLKRVRAAYADQIFDAEMKLREALTFIFADSYGKNFYGLLNDISIKWPGGKAPDEKVMRAEYENQFFYLTFSDYIEINAFKSLNFDQFRASFADYQSFEDLKYRMTGRPIRAQHHVDFLSSLKELMDAIEKARNCVAHNRVVPSETAGNYQQSYENLLDAIKAFLQEEATLADEAELPEII